VESEEIPQDGNQIMNVMDYTVENEINDPYENMEYVPEEEYPVAEDDEVEQTLGQLMKKNYGHVKKIKMTIKLAEKASYQKNAAREKLKYFAPKLISLYLTNKGYTHIVRIPYFECFNRILE
jgi:hypothetical protein